jgi:hypothetical protein
MTQEPPLTIGEVAVVTDVHPAKSDERKGNPS